MSHISWHFPLSSQANNFFATGSVPCGNIGCWWQVDLGIETDVLQVSIWNRADTNASAQRSAGITVWLSSGSGDNFLSTGSQCSPVPDSLLQGLVVAGTPEGYYADVPCSATGRYVTILAAAGLPVSLSEVAVFAANACPQYVTTGDALQSAAAVCGPNAPYGAVCINECPSNKVRTAGATTTTCRGSGWDSPPLVCEPQCAALDPPTNAVGCTMSLVADSFNPNIDTATSTAAHWFSLYDDPSTSLGAAWFIQDDKLQASASWGCDDEIFLVSGSVAAQTHAGSFTASVDAYTADRAGLVRAIDSDNFVRFSIDIESGLQTIDANIYGELFELSYSAWPLKPLTWYSLSISVVGSTINAAIDGVIVMTTTYPGVSTGFVGVYAGTTAQFDNFLVSAPCSSCIGATPGDMCTFTCAAGYAAAGNSSRACTLNGDGTTSWSDSPLQCILLPPAISAATRAVPENSARGTFVGAPLVGFVADPTATVQWEIVRTSNVSTPFAIDGCSGQIWVNQPVLNYELVSSYVLNVSLSIAGSPYRSFATVVVNILNVQEPPIIVTGQSFNISAGATVGSIIGRVAYWVRRGVALKCMWAMMCASCFLIFKSIVSRLFTLPPHNAWDRLRILLMQDPENDTAVFNMVVDGSSGIVAFTNTTSGSLGVQSTSGLNYYTGKRSYLLQIACHDPSNAAFAASGSVVLTVTEAPTPPVIQPAQIIAIPWTASSLLGTAATSPVAATLEANLFNSTRYRSTLSYSIVPYPSALTLCSLNATGNASITYATSTGAAGASPLFAISPGSSVIVVAATPTPVPWIGRTTFALGGNFALASYSVCVNASTSFGQSAFAPVTVAMTVPSQTVAVAITSYRLATGLPGGTAGLMIDTVAPTTIYFVGIGFNSVPFNTTGVVRANYSNAAYSYVATGCIAYNSTLLTCNSVPGVGAGLTWSIALSGALVPSTIPLVTSYYAPTVSSLANNTAIPCTGGVEIVINGRYLGTVAGASIMSYGPSLSNLLYSCVLRKPSWPLVGPGTDTQSSCIAAAGAGTALAWQISVGGQVVFGTSTAAASQTLSYAPPAVLSLAANATLGVNATTHLDTRGGQSFTITGRNFGGSAATSIISVLYGKSGLGSPQFPATCQPWTSSTTLTCATSAGVGDGLLLTVDVNGQISAPTSQELGYAAPVVTSVTGGHASMDTAGGTIFYVTGNYFGTGAIPIDWVKYGPIGVGGVTKYTAVNCVVISAQTMLQCSAAAGSGGAAPGYYLQLSVGGQGSNVFAAQMSYAPPVISGFQPTGGLETSGGQTVLLTGVNFGPYQDPTLVITASYSTAAGTLGAAYSYPASNCAVTVANTQITCTTAPGAGAALTWELMVDGLKSITATTSYAPPAISSIVTASGAPITAALSPNAQTTLILLGSNFGQPDNAQYSYGFGGMLNTSSVPKATDLLTSITYGPSGTEYTPSSWTHLNDTAIRVVVGPGTGTSCYFRVTVAGQTTTAAVPAFSFQSPIIMWISPNHGPTYNPPGNATVITLGITDPPVFDPLYDLMVRIGSGSTWATIVPDLPETDLDLQKATNPDGTISIRFTLPKEWAGTNLGVQLVPEGAGNASSSSPLTNLTQFSYDAPLVSEVFVMPATFTAGTSDSSLSARLLTTPACPWGTSNPTWSCLPAATNPHGQLYLTVLYGKNFGANPVTCANSSTTPPRICDPVTRHLDFLPPATNVTPAPAWTEASWWKPGVVDAAQSTVVFWSDSIIAVYSYAPTASLAVRLTNMDAFGKAKVVASAPWKYASGQQPVVLGFSVSGVAAALGHATNAPTAGGVPLAVTIAGPAGAAGQYVIEVDYTVCPNVGNAVCGAASCVYTCTLPAGQGTTNLVRVIDTTVGYQYQALAGVISYLGPTITQFQTWQYYPSSLWPTTTTPGWVSAPLTGVGIYSYPIVYMPTNGSLLQVVGTNLGTAPALIINPGIPSDAPLRQVVVGGANVWQCPGRALGTCWIFNVPGGDGAGFAYSPAGFHVFLLAGDQSSHDFSVTSPQFQYNPPTVTSVSSSSTIPGCSFPTLGVCSDNKTITITLRGYDFGEPIEAFGETSASSKPTVSFYRPVDVGGFATAFQCGNVVRQSDFLMTCTLPRGSGGGLTIRVQAIEAQWFGDSKPGFSYDAPVITEAYVAYRDLPLAAPPCYNSTLEYYDNLMNATLTNVTLVCPPAPPRPPALPPTSLIPRALNFNIPNGNLATTANWASVWGGVAVNGSFAGLPPSPLAVASGALLAGPTSEGQLAAGGSGVYQFFTYITLYGSNFGDAAPGLHCPRMAWSFRNATGNAPPVCDGIENFLGEGEVDSIGAHGRVLKWTQDMIIFAVPSGIGLRDVDLNVRGNGLALPPGDPRRPRFQYMAPIITTVTPQRLDAAGGTLVTVTGYNFGPLPWQSSQPGLAIGNSASFSVPISLAPTLPTASLRIQFGSNVSFGPQCVSSALRLDGAVSPYVSPPWANCLAGPDWAVSPTQNTLSFYAPPGVGALHSVTIVYVDGPAVNPLTATSKVPPIVISSAPFNVSYMPPEISGPQNPVSLIQGTAAVANNSLKILGFQFGPTTIDAPPPGVFWSDQDKQLNVTIGGIPCLRPSRFIGVTNQAAIQCTPDPLNSVVGTWNINLTVGGQAATSAVPVTVACGPGYFGRPGETCVTCAPPNLHLMNVLAVPGVPGTPSVICNGYAATVPQDQTCFLTPDELAYLAQLPPIPSAMLSAANLPPSIIANFSSFQARFNASGPQYGGIGTQICPTFPYPAPQPGYFNLNGSMASQCPPGLAYPNRDLCITPCLNDMCAADNICMPGYASLPPHYRCSSCAPAGYSGPGSPAYFWRGGVCVACPAGYQGIIIGYVIGIAVVALIAYITQRWGLHICSAAIGIDFFQVVALFASSKVSWPSQMQTMLTILSAFYANVEIVAPECLDPNATFSTKFTGIVLLPIMFAAVLLVVHALLLFSKVVVMGRHNEVNRHANTLVGAALVLMYFLYIYETRTVLSVFDCAPLTPSDGLTYMAAAPLEECDTSVDGVYAKLIIPSIIGLVIYTAGYPIAALAIMWRQRETIMEDQLLRAKGVGDDRLTNPHAYELRKRFSGLYASFTPDSFFWLFIILMRKFLIALSIVVFNGNASFQMAACLMVLMVAYGLQVRNSPYLSPANAEAVLRAHAEASFTSTIHARIRASIAGVESRGRKRTRRNLLDGAGRVDRSALLGLLTSWLFDPNTLESALLFAAAIVALMGIMFESEALQSNQYAGTHTAVTAVAMTVIIIGIICKCLFVDAS